jgi:hypothetical protein
MPIRVFPGVIGLAEYGGLNRPMFILIESGSHNISWGITNDIA